MLRLNTTQLAVGLQDGTLLLLALGHESVRAPDGSGIVTVVPLLVSTPADRAAQTNASHQEQPAAAVMHLMFTKNKQRRLLILLDAAGLMVLLSPSSGRVLLQQQVKEVPLAVNLNSECRQQQECSSAAPLLPHLTGSAGARQHGDD
eukprot:gene7971-8169_t